MKDLVLTAPPELERSVYTLYRDFFDKAEKKRRWNIREDIPWDQCNKSLDPAIADVVESFCAVELYLPDYTSKILPLVRFSKGRTWFYANWGYEEGKHSISLGDWLLRSGARSEEYMADLEKTVFSVEWNLPMDTHLGMLVYAMVQEQATFVNYRNLKIRCKERGGDTALETLLTYVSVDEKAHHSFFRDCFKLFLDFDRPVALEALKRVMNNFAMPAIHDLIPDSHTRVQNVRNLEIFSDIIYYRDVYLPIIEDLGVHRSEMRAGSKLRKSMRETPTVQS